MSFISKEPFLFAKETCSAVGARTGEKSSQLLHDFLYEDVHKECLLYEKSHVYSKKSHAYSQKSHVYSQKSPVVLSPRQKVCV